VGKYKVETREPLEALYKNMIETRTTRFMTCIFIVYGEIENDVGR
jgi:hypothetical protein